LESVHNAIEQGKTVASTILGKKIPYDQVPWFWSDQYNLKLQIAGLISDYDDYIIRGERDEDSFAVFYLKDGKICASDCINRAAEHMVSRKIISEGISLEPEKLVDELRPIKDLLN
jgi:3-phenylpropionate/trans-cinnamate dioxygenase ferredoxin reductase subunit